MKQKSKAVIVRALNQPVVVEEIEVDPPGPTEVMVKLAACGICHSDLSVVNGTIPMPTPVVLGHEGAGTVVQIGRDVTDFTVGDSVISSFVNMCGRCRYCTEGRPNLCDNVSKAVSTLPNGELRTRDSNGEPLNVMVGCGVMSEYATLHQDNLVKITHDVPLERCALIGCGVMTGWGAVCNTAKVTPGSIAVVFGIGGVGLNAIQGCVNSGASMIVAVDNNPDKLLLAKVFGATHTVDASAVDNVPKAIRKLTGGGADYAFECVGLGSIVAQAYACLRKGGTAVIVGMAPMSDRTSLPTMSLSFEEKVVRGSYYGSARPRTDFPKLLSLHQAGRLKLAELITRRYSIDEAPTAFSDLASGRNARGVIIFD